MKKILYAIIAIIFMGAAFADYDFSQAVQNTTMPTDAEIREVISQFNFTKEQQEIIFKDTKRRLQQMYSAQNSAQTNAQLNQYYKEVKKGSFDEVLDPTAKKEFLQEVSTLPELDSSTVQQETAEQDNKGFKSKGFKTRHFQSKKDRK